MRSAIQLAASTIVFLQLILLLAAGGLSAWSKAPDVVVVGPSMEPGVPRGSLVINDQPSSDNMQPGAVALIKVGDRLVTHRIAEVLASGKLITKGDANLEADTDLVDDEQVVGIATAVVPYVGLPRAWVAAENYSRLIIWIALCGVATAALLGWRPEASEQRR